MARKKRSADKDVPNPLGTAETTPVIPVSSEDPPPEAISPSEPEAASAPVEVAEEAPSKPTPKKRKRKTLSKEAQVLADALPADSLTESAGGEHQDEPEPEAVPQPEEEQLEPVAVESEDAELSAPETTELKLVMAEEVTESETGTEVSEPEPDFIDPNAPEITTQQVVEAILFVSDTALTLPKIVSMLGVGSARDVKKHIEELNKRYVKEGATFRIEKIAGGYQMLTLPQFNTWLRRLRESRQDSRFSAAALETLSVVAYKQPVTRADIEAIRGVAAGEMLNRLRELNLVKIVGRAEDVGRPMLYGTTKRFLEVFGLASLDELPQVEQMQIAQ